jgi:CRISPR-associated protein (TIGR02584 family)
VKPNGDRKSGKTPRSIPARPRQTHISSAAPSSRPRLLRSAPVRARSAETVLFAVAGMSPSVLTETVWALAHGNPPVVPDRVVVLTTCSGRACLRTELFTPRPDFDGACVWESLRAALAHRGTAAAGRLRFGDTADDIRVFTMPDPARGRSVELEDIRTPAESAAAADFILEKLRSFTENQDTRIVASLAGGRKTMSVMQA